MPDLVVRPGSAAQGHDDDGGRAHEGADEPQRGPGAAGAVAHPPRDEGGGEAGKVAQRVDERDARRRPGPLRKALGRDQKTGSAAKMPIAHTLIAAMTASGEVR